MGAGGSRVSTTHTEGVSSQLHHTQTARCVVRYRCAVMCTRMLELVFFFYFASHIPITLFIDLQALLPDHVYPDAVSVTLRNRAGVRSMQ